MRRLAGVLSAVLLGFLLVALPLAPALAGVEDDMELGVNRGGSDYTSFIVADADPAACAAACTGDGSCTAWTFVKPGVQGAQAICYLKNQTPQASADACCISGVVREAGQAPGGGQQTFALPEANGAAVDWCATFGADCGQAGADQFCRTQGFAAASAWNWGYADRTWVIGSAMYCEAVGACGALRDVTCTAATGGGGGGGGSPGAITVRQATYGGNCGAPFGNATGFLQGTCDGRASCDYVVDYTVLGDPASGCGKDFTVDWICGDGSQGQASAAPEAGFGARVSLTCPAP